MTMFEFFTTTIGAWIIATAHCSVRYLFNNGTLMP